MEMTNFKNSSKRTHIEKKKSQISRSRSFTSFSSKRNNSPQFSAKTRPGRLLMAVLGTSLKKAEEVLTLKRH